MNSYIQSLGSIFYISIVFSRAIVGGIVKRIGPTPPPTPLQLYSATYKSAAAAIGEHVSGSATVLLRRLLQAHPTFPSQEKIIKREKRKD